MQSPAWREQNPLHRPYIAPPLLLHPSVTTGLAQASAKETFDPRREHVKIHALILTATLIVPMTMTAQTTISKSKSSHLSANDQLFLHTLASEDESEIQLAKLAMKKSSDPQIQQYAKTKILAADPSMEQQAKEVAQQENAQISAEPNATQKAQYKNLSKLSGKDFDRAYVKYEDRKQKADLVDVQNKTVTAMSTKVRDFAQKQVTPVKQAAQAAEQLAQSMNIKPTA